MKKSVILGVSGLFIVLGVYFYFLDKEYLITISEAEIQQKLSEKMPFSQSYLVFLKATFDNPRVKLTHHSHRIHAGLDVVLNLQLADIKRPFGGSVDVSGAIRYDSKEGHFYLTNAKIEKLTIQGFPDKYLAQATVLIEKMLVEYYQTHPVYTLKSTDAKQQGIKMVLKEVVIEDQSLVVTLGI